MSRSSKRYSWSVIPTPALFVTITTFIRFNISCLAIVAAGYVINLALLPKLLRQKFKIYLMGVMPKKKKNRLMLSYFF